MRELFLVLLFLFSSGLAKATYWPARSVSPVVLRGNYKGCAPSIYGAGFFNYYDVRIRKKRLVYTDRLHTDPNCEGAALNVQKEVYRFKKIKKIHLGGGITKYELDLKTRKIQVTMNDAGYFPYLNDISECGFTDWAAGITRKVTGRTCDFLLSADSFHDTYRARGELYYISVILDKSSGTHKELSYPLFFSESGDNSAERIDEEFVCTRNDIVCPNS